MTDGHEPPPGVRLTVLEARRVLRVARGGRLQPWLGPALRGLAGGRLRARACRPPVADQLCRWARCAGCPLMAGCAYGETLEPDPPAARPDDLIPLTVTFVGPAAAGHAAAFCDALHAGGADPLLGLGEDRVLFDVLPGDGPDRRDALDLAADPGYAPAVRMVLAASPFTI